MKKFKWKIEYSVTLLIVIGLILLLIPMTFFGTKEANYISKWNEVYNKVEYMFTAMVAQADDNIVRNLHRAQTNDEREQLMIKLVNPYLRINEGDEVSSRYKPRYLNGNLVHHNDDYYFEKMYISKNSIVVGLKDIQNKDIFHPGFLMMFDVNGTKAPNTWGKDIYGINIFIDGKISPLGYGWDIALVKEDCSKKGRGISCSHYYRIGGEFSD